MIEVKRPQTWSDFVREVEDFYSEAWARADERLLRRPLFRGLGNSLWMLETTLERFYKSENLPAGQGFLQYYAAIGQVKGIVESYTGRTWQNFLPFPEMQSLVRQGIDTVLQLDSILNSQIELYQYLLYLRHHGFPSPLLDWSASPYVAAFFAFDNAAADAESVSVIMVQFDTVTSASLPAASLFLVGPNIATHQRHHLQQSFYTLCSKAGESDYQFAPQMEGLEGQLGEKGRVIKLELPVSLRVSALKELDRMNINPHSLFANEDGLVRTVARRALLFQEPYF